jgi:peroxiredoxin
VDDARAAHSSRQPMDIMMMTDLRRLWRVGSLLIVMMVTAPGVLMLLQQWGYWADDATSAVPVSSRTILAPEFALRDLDGTLRHLASFRGRVVLLHFWATWCPPCRTEMLSMAGLYQAYKDDGFEVVAVASDVQGAQVVQPFVAQLHLSFTTLLDPTGQVTRLYGVTTLPTTYLLDRDGRLVTVAIGGHDWATADASALIKSLLDAGQQAAVPRDSEARRRLSSGEVQKIAGRPQKASETFEWW